MTTCQPCAQRISVVAKPMPRAAPVMRAVFMIYLDVFYRVHCAWGRGKRLFCFNPVAQL
jgi:hypothetical protein